MTRGHFTSSEISGALQALEAGIRVPEVCHRFGVSELTLGRWRRKAGLLKKPLEPTELEQAARPLESQLSVSAVRARLLLGLPSRRRGGHPVNEPAAPHGGGDQPGTYLRRSGE